MTTQQTHTPGPWTVKTETAYGEIQVYGIEGPTGETIVETDSGVYPPKLPDARLIALSPEMYAELVKILRRYTLQEDDQADVEALVAKAEGRD